MDAKMLLYIVVGIVLFAVVAIVAIPKVEPVVKNVSSSVDSIPDNIDRICGMDESIYEHVENAFGDDPKVREILELRELGQTYPECGLAQLYKYLGEENRKKISWTELACDVSHCTQVLYSESKP